MRRLSENNALSSMKNSSDFIPTLTTERITFDITMHVVQFLIYAIIDPSHKSFWSKSIMQFKSLRGSSSPKALSTTTYIHHTHRNHGRHK